MRSIDKEFNTPMLRKYNLLYLNTDGFMMTRTLAENYPYSRVYKAAIKGGRKQWLSIIDIIEKGELDPSRALDYILILLIRKSKEFEQISDEALQSIACFLEKDLSFETIYTVISSFISKAKSKTKKSARVFEVAMHALLQACAEFDALDGSLKPLQQMRSANKKHKNIGDVEVLDSLDSTKILEAWDAKYGKRYLQKELEELGEKLVRHPETRIAGFVANGPVDLRDDVVIKKDQLQQSRNVRIELLSFDEWVTFISNRANVDKHDLAKHWLLAFAESICQRRRKIAPIDEPSFEWVRDLRDYIDALNNA